MSSTNKKQPFLNQKPIGTDTVAVPPDYCTVETFLWSEMESSQRYKQVSAGAIKVTAVDTLRQQANLSGKR